jgi:uncharacterized membrane protein YqhA
MADFSRGTTKRRPAPDAQTRADVVKIVDTYLFVAILVLVAFGLYELFIGRLDARRTDDAPRLLVANSLEELKDRIAKVVVRARPT